MRDSKNIRYLNVFEPVCTRLCAASIFAAPMAIYFFATQ